jgi:hypothetical protein
MGLNYGFDVGRCVGVEGSVQDERDRKKRRPAKIFAQTLALPQMSGNVRLKRTLSHRWNPVVGIRRGFEMRPVLILAVMYSLASFPAQTDLWKKVGDSDPKLRPKTYAPSQAELVRVKKALAARVRLDKWCGRDDRVWTENLEFEELPVSVTEKIVLVEAGPGCARGGQGSNGAMWVIRFQGDKFSFLATPEQQFNGWLYSIPETTSHGFRDLVLGWHMSAFETDLSYFRFDGTCYQLIGAATHVTDENGAEKIIPQPVSGVAECKVVNA